MAKRIQALVTPELLTWARETAGYSIDELASKLKQAPETITAWEEGSQRPYMGQLRRIATICKRSVSDFYLPTPPERETLPHDFRRSPGEIAMFYSPALRQQLRLAKERRELALSLYDGLSETVPIITESTSGMIDPELVGQKIREMLNIDFSVQRKLGDGRPAYSFWRQHLESVGCLIFQILNVSANEAWGFSIVDHPLPVIGVNRALAPNGRTFTLLHEFVHVLRNESSICDIDDFTTRDPSDLAIEAYCNSVAASTLMPQIHFMDHDAITNRSSSGYAWQDDEIRALASTFGVSREAAVRRLVTLKLTTMEFYISKRRQYHAEREEARTRQLEKSKDREIRRNMPREALSNLGRRFVGLILQNYHEDRITLLDASDYLGVRAEKVEALGKLIAA